MKEMQNMLCSLKVSEGIWKVKACSSMKVSMQIVNKLEYRIP